MGNDKYDGLLSQEEIDALLASVDTEEETQIAGILRAVDSFAECNGMKPRALKNIIESTLIREFLVQTEGNVSKVARELNMPRRTLRSKIERYGIKVRP